jgi:hypothetical protein
MPSDLLAAARVFQIPGPARPPHEPAPAPVRSVGSVLPEGTLRPEPGLPHELPAELEAGPNRPDGPDGPDGPLDPSSPGTLLAVVPIPGTDSSLAIVGYTIPASAPRDRVSAPRDRVPVPRQNDGGLVVDHARRCIWLGGKEVQLTYQEFELLAFLSANPSQVFSRADLLERV